MHLICIEGDYGIGNVSSTLSSELFESGTSDWDVEAIGRLQISIVDLFGKAGLMFWSTDVTLLGKAYTYQAPFHLGNSAPA